MDAKEKVLATMKEAGQPLNAGKIAELSGLDRKEVDAAMKQLKAEGAIVSPVRCKWAPASKVYTAVLKYRQQYLYFYQNVKVRNLNILAYGHNYPLHLFGVRCRRMAVSVSWFKDA